jgi:hypothetical protein
MRSNGKTSPHDRAPAAIRAHEGSAAGDDDAIVGPLAQMLAGGAVRVVAAAPGTTTLRGLGVEVAPEHRGRPEPISTARADNGRGDRAPPQASAAAPPRSIDEAWADGPVDPWRTLGGDALEAAVAAADEAMSARRQIAAPPPKLAADRARGAPEPSLRPGGGAGGRTRVGAQARAAEAEVAEPLPSRRAVPSPEPWRGVASSERGGDPVDDNAATAAIERFDAEEARVGASDPRARAALGGLGPRENGTLKLARPQSHARIAIALLSLTAVGVLVATYIAFGRDGLPLAEDGQLVAGSTTPPAQRSTPGGTAEPASPLPAALEAVASAQVAEGPTAGSEAAYVDVLIQSSPPGATVTLIDRGKPQFVGTTPVSAAVDPTRRYDLVLSHPEEPTRILTLDAASPRRLHFALGRRGEVGPGARAAAARSPTSRERRSGPVPAAEAGEGILMISSKPPCAITIDGRATGLITPQRAIALPAGVHEIVLVNDAERISKQLKVRITANESTRVIEDLMPQ